MTTLLPDHSTTLLRALVGRLPHLKGRGLADLVRANRARRAGVTLGRAMREARRRGGAVGNNQQED